MFQINSKWLQYICLAILCAVGLLYHIPFHDVQGLLSPGDHGLNLYAAERVLEGDMPYQDFHWFYGPGMLYYYAGVMSFLGISIKSVLIGNVILKIMSGVVVFALCRLYMTPVLALAAAGWYWSSNIGSFYTYSHSGGILFNLLIFYSLLRFLKTHRISALYWGLGLVFIQAFIKLNFGIVMWLGYTAAVIAIRFFAPDRPKFDLKRFLLWSLIALPAGVLAGHLYFVNGMPYANIKQCFQLLGDDPYMQQNNDILANILSYVSTLSKKMIRSLPEIVFALIVLLIGGKGVYDNILNNDKKSTQGYALFWGLWLMFYVASLHEYIMSAIPFRSVWAQPFEILFVFFAVHFGMSNLKKTVKYCLVGVLCALPLMAMLKSYTTLQQIKQPKNLLAHDRADVYVTNSREMISVMMRTVYYIEYHIPLKDKIFVLPYDPLYYFLANKTAPTRQLAFFDFTMVERPEQLQIIADLENNDTKWIIQSNRINTEETAMGYFGRTNNRTLNAYIESNFSEIARYGDWRKPGGWAWSHATRILKRNDVP